MARRRITLSQAIDGYMLAAAARRLSPHTIADYTNTFRKFLAFLGDDLPLDAITPQHVRRFLASLAGPPTNLTAKTLLNYHTGLSALWTWAVEEGIATCHIVRQVARPRPERRAIEPFSEADVRALLSVVDRSRPYRRPGKRISTHGRPTAARDRAILLLLLDTGIRASELCGLRLEDVDLRNHRIRVRGKGGRERLLPVSPATAKAMWRYGLERGDGRRMYFLTEQGRPLTRLALLAMCRNLGQRASVLRCHPHRFRHTFAINFLRNGGNVYELQMALGHATLEMPRRYLALAEVDLEDAHAEASPVQAWGLG